MDALVSCSCFGMGLGSASNAKRDAARLKASAAGEVRPAPIYGIPAESRRRPRAGAAGLSENAYFTHASFVRVHVLSGL